jgi:hypothetical protein
VLTPGRLLRRGDRHGLEAHRTFFARLITASVGVPPQDGRLAAAFAATPRERFVGVCPCRVFTPVGYIEMPCARGCR